MARLGEHNGASTMPCKKEEKNKTGENTVFSFLGKTSKKETLIHLGIAQIVSYPSTSISTSTNSNTKTYFSTNRSTNSSTKIGTSTSAEPFLFLYFAALVFCAFLAFFGILCFWGEGHVPPILCDRITGSSTSHTLICKYFFHFVT